MARVACRVRKLYVRSTRGGCQAGPPAWCIWTRWGCPAALFPREGRGKRLWCTLEHDAAILSAGTPRRTTPVIIVSVASCVPLGRAVMPNLGVENFGSGRPPPLTVAGFRYRNARFPVPGWFASVRFVSISFCFVDWGMSGMGSCRCRNDAGWQAHAYGTGHVKWVMDEEMGGNTGRKDLQLRYSTKMT